MTVALQRLLRLVLCIPIFTKNITQNFKKVNKNGSFQPAI